MKKEGKFYNKWWFWLLVFLFLIGIVGNSQQNNSSNSQKSNKKKETNVESLVYLKGTKAKDFYGILCDVANLQKKEPSTTVCDSIEYSSSDANYLIEVGANKNTDEISYVTITPIQASDPTNLFMSLNRLDYNGKDSSEITNFIATNIGKTAEKKIGDLVFSTWISSTTGKTVLSAKTPDFDDYMLNCK